MPRTARLFWLNGEPAIRLPRDHGLPGARVLIERQGRSILLSPVAGQASGEMGQRSRDQALAQRREEILALFGDLPANDNVLTLPFGTPRG